MPGPIKVCLFDAYGTLFDLYSAAARFSADVGPQAAALSQLWRNKQVEYSWIRSAMAPPADGWRDFWHLTEDALKFSLASLKIDQPDIMTKLLGAYMTLDAFPEALETLRRLKAMGMKTAILSNGTQKMLKSALDSSGLSGVIDVVASADEVKIFKPSPRLYQLIPDKFGVAPHEVQFHSSNAWDAASAASFGFRVAFINRNKQPPEYPFAAMAVELADLSAIPDLVRETLSA